MLLTCGPTLFAGDRPLLQKTGWETAADPAALRAATERAGAFALPPGNAHSALVVTRPPGGYTAQGRG